MPKDKAAGRGGLHEKFRAFCWSLRSGRMRRLPSDLGLGRRGHLRPLLSTLVKRPRARTRREWG
jgi:hypothetical protein